jgi:hypothetical protein
MYIITHAFRSKTQEENQYNLGSFMCPYYYQYGSDVYRYWPFLIIPDHL